MLTFLVYNLKGGVGKTTTAVNLAHKAAKKGLKTLIWDLDVQGGCSYYLFDKHTKSSSKKSILKKKFSDGILETDFENLYLLPSNDTHRNLAVETADIKDASAKLEKVLNNMHKKFDVVFIDCPPTLSNLADALFRVAKFIVMPVIPSILSIEVARKVKDFLKSKSLTHIKFFPFFNLVSLSRTQHKELIANRRDLGFLDTFVRQSSEVEKMSLYHKPLCAFSKKSASQEFGALYDEIFSFPDVDKRIKLIHKMDKTESATWVRKMVATSNLIF